MRNHAILDAPDEHSPADGQPTGVGQRPEAEAPRLGDGVELVGEFQGSGYREPKYLVSRSDGQVIQLPYALFVLAATLNGDRRVEDIARILSTEHDATITPDQVAHLIETKLRPAGLAAARDGGPAIPVTQPRDDPLLMLRFRLPVVSQDVVWRIAGVFAPMFRPVVVALTLLAFLAVDITLLAGGAAAAVVPSTLALVEAPVLALLVLGLLTLSGLLHECGHVGACRYGGARPGAMGVGIYLVWPAFYSTVTDSYRLSRAGRLRTDLGGVYVNAAVLAATGAGYLWTGAPWLLVAVLALHVETARQFLPSIRLDGYYILSDLIGLPDLFMFLRPVLTSVLPGRPTHPKVAELRPRVRRIIIAWVLIVVPVLLGFLVVFVALAPQILPVVWTTLLDRLTSIAGAVRADDTALATLTATQVLFLLLPVLGVTLLVGALLRRVVGWLRVNPRRRPARDAPKPLANFAVVAVPVVLLGLLALAGLDQRVVSEGEAATAAGAAAVATGLGPAGVVPPGEIVAAHQIAALDALFGGLGQTGATDSARAVLLLVGVVSALLLWPLCRGLRLPASICALVVAVAGLPALVTSLFGTVEPGGLAALWLTVAAVCVRRGTGGNIAAFGAAVLAVLTAPVAAVALLAFAAHGVAVGKIAKDWKRGAARVLVVALAVAAVLAAVRTVPVGSFPDGAIGGPVLAGVLILGGAVIVFVELRLATLGPLATAAGALLLCAAVPGPRSGTAVLLALPVLALLVGTVVYRHTHSTRRALQPRILAAVLVAAVLLAGPLLLAASQAAPARAALGAWVTSELDPTTTLQADPLIAAELVGDGVRADRLVPVGDPAGDLLVEPGASASTGQVLLTLPVGPGGRPVTVSGPADPGDLDGVPGILLADNPALTLDGDAAAVLRSDGVDPRLTTTLAGLTGVHDVRVAAFPVAPGEPAANLRRTALVTEIDGVPVTDTDAAAVLTRWLDGQQPPFRPSDVIPTDGGLAVHYTLPRRPA